MADLDWGVQRCQIATGKVVAKRAPCACGDGCVENIPGGREYAFYETLGRRTCNILGIAKEAVVFL